MIEQTQNNRTMLVTVLLAECPWLVDTNPVLPGYVHRDYTHTLGNVRKCQLHPGIIIQCFESVSGKYIVQLHYGHRADEVDKAQAIAALQQWIQNLDEPASCKLDLDLATALNQQHEYW